MNTFKPGYDIRVLSKEGDELPPNTLGTLAIKLPLPPVTLPTLYEADERFIEEYLTAYPGFYDTKDAGMVDDDGYVHIMVSKNKGLRLPSLPLNRYKGNLFHLLTTSNRQEPMILSTHQATDLARVLWKRYSWSIRI